MKLRGGRYRAVAKANRLSPEIIIVSEVVPVHWGVDSRLATVKGRGCENPTGSEMTARYYKELI